MHAHNPGGDEDVDAREVYWILRSDAELADLRVDVDAGRVLVDPADLDAPER